MKLWILAIILALATASAGAQELKWHRLDGQPISANPINLQRAQADLTICQGERAKVIASGAALNSRGRQDAGQAVLEGCMAQRGYVLR